jgi:hypothetical protein
MENSTIAASTAGLGLAPVVASPHRRAAAGLRNFGATPRILVPGMTPSHPRLAAIALGLTLVLGTTTASEAPA